jgi:hypothetical protein
MTLQPQIHAHLASCMMSSPLDDSDGPPPLEDMSAELQRLGLRGSREMAARCVYF